VSQVPIPVAPADALHQNAPAEVNGLGMLEPSAPAVHGGQEHPIHQVVDPDVTRAKYDAEVAEYRQIEDGHRRRGWWLVDATFPRVFVVFATPQLRPPAVVCGVDVDFTNYDFEPPSVRLVDPFTREPYRRKDLPTALFRRQMQQVALGGGVHQVAGHVELMQAHAPEEIPFLCIPGVREYHAHPAHTGDSWFLHRGLGVGKLYHILNTVYQYGVQPISNYGVGLRVVGFEQGQPPA
jgi:hypothetical protein